MLYVRRGKQVRRARKFYLINSDRSRASGYGEGSDKGNRDHEKRGKEKERGGKIVSRKGTKGRDGEREKCGKSEELIEVGKGAKGGGAAGGDDEDG